MMKKDETMKNILKDQWKEEVESIYFDQKGKEHVLHTISTQSFLKRWLEYEIEIPLTSMVAVLLIFCISTGIFTYPMLKVEEQEIINSRIEVIYSGKEG
jgi:hypothetical protein